MVLREICTAIRQMKPSPHLVAKHYTTYSNKAYNHVVSLVYLYTVETFVGGPSDAKAARVRILADVVGGQTEQQLSCDVLRTEVIPDDRCPRRSESRRFPISWLQTRAGVGKARWRTEA